MMITIGPGRSVSGRVDFPATGESFTITGSYDSSSGKFSLSDGSGFTANGSATPEAMKGAVKKPDAAAPTGFAAKKR